MGLLSREYVTWMITPRRQAPQDREILRPRTQLRFAHALAGDGPAILTDDQRGLGVEHLGHDLVVGAPVLEPGGLVGVQELPGHLDCGVCRGTETWEEFK